MPLKGDGAPPRATPLTVRFTMGHHAGPVPCHVSKVALDRIGARQARTPGEMLERFDRNRARFESIASVLYDQGHRTPWITEDHVFTGIPEDHEG